mmetsp:Transcript_894/g.2370  ORF Transcript_894/g.2370 Transcript_894/m.2370 type:complete len:142 (-) Transcript_894:102-527(-)
MFYFAGYEGWNHVKQMTLPPLVWLMTISWDNFGKTLIDVVLESEDRRDSQPTRTYLGHLAGSDFTALRPGEFTTNWAPPDAGTEWRMLSASKAIANVGSARAAPDAASASDGRGTPDAAPPHATADVMEMRPKPSGFCGCI